MVLQGVVTNVAAFGAFVDIGVHQDGLVHVSAMSRTFVSDPHSVVKSGDVVRVKVLSVDIPAPDLAEPTAGRRPSPVRPLISNGPGRPPRSRSGRPAVHRPSAEAPDGALADALRGGPGTGAEARRTRIAAVAGSIG